MRILNAKPFEKINLPCDGKIAVRWVKGRAVWQVYAGGRYVSGANGDTREIALEQLFYQYNIPQHLQSTCK